MLFRSSMKVKSESEVAQLCLTLIDLMDCSLPGSSVHGFSRQEYWSGLPFPFPGDLPDPGIEAGSPALYTDALSSEPPGKLPVAPRAHKHGREELPDVRGQGQKPGGPHAQGAAAKRSYPTSEVRGGSREEQPNVQGAVAARAQEG